MTSNGNHGGNTNEETSAMFMFMDTYLPPYITSQKREAVRQIDLPVTLAMLMGVSIPRHSLGVVISSLFHQDELKNIKKLNRMQLLATTTTTTTENNNKENIYELQRRLLRENRPEIPLLCLLLLLLLSVVFFILWTRTIIMATNLEQIHHGFGILVLISICLFSSSYVENEYALWYMFLNTWILYRVVVEIRVRNHRFCWFLVVAMICLRIMRERDQIINFAVLNNLQEPVTMLSGSSVVNEPSLLLLLNPCICLRFYSFAIMFYFVIYLRRDVFVSILYV